jgi:hypothetical protein
MSEASKDQPKQSSSANKSLGAKDSKALKHNKNRSLEAPDMPDLSKEKEIQRRATSRKGYQHVGYPQKTREKVIELTGQGKTLTEISSLPGMPHAHTVRSWKAEDPDFAEEMEQAFSDYVDEVAKGVVPKLQQALELRGFSESILDQAENLPTLKQGPRDGLHKKLMINLLHAEKKGRTLASTAGVILAYAERRAQYWRKDTEGAANMVVIDMNLDMDKKTDLPGTATGQNANALTVMRNVTPKK